MKTLTLLSSLLLLCCSCKGKHDYKLKLIYMTTNSSGVPRLVDRGQSIHAQTDSEAYEKALLVNHERMQLNTEAIHDQYDHFELYNSEDVLVTSQAVEKTAKNN